MANYLGWEITNKGRELLARAMNNETKINVTKFKIGAGYNTGNDRELTDLLDKRNEFPVNSYERKENGNVEFTFIVSNKTGSGTSAITNSYKISEMGIYARDDFGTEILYAYNKGTDGDYIPVFNGKNAIDIMEKCIIVVDQSANLNVTIDSSNTYITRDSAERNYVKKTDYATENKAGIVTLGTATNTALEGKRLAEIIGMEFGGKIQDSGIKIAGKFYYDTVTKFYYECIVNNNLTYNDSSKFRAISNKPISDRVENLYTIETHVIFEHLTQAKVFKIGRLCILSMDSNDAWKGTTSGTVLFTLPENFRPLHYTVAPLAQLGTTESAAAQIETDGRVIYRGHQSIKGALYFNVTYLTK
jgi:hypothetical protein